jgi:hypothetical protein
MKKLILLLITLTTFTNVSYASFPVTANSQTELIYEDIELPTYENRQSIWGILSITFALISLLLYVSAFIYNNLGMLSAAWGLGIFALIFGLIGLFTRKSKSLALTGLILGFLESIAAILIIIAVGGIAGGN